MSEIVKFTSLSSAYSLGLDEAQVSAVCMQVSGMIEMHNQETRAHFKEEHGKYPDTDEMLPKTPQELLRQLELGQSVYVLERTDAGLLVHHHSSLYELFSEPLARRLGYQLFELGSAITRKESRGKHYGQEGARLRLERMECYAAEHEVEVVAVTTVKRALTRHVWESRGAQIIAFQRHVFASSQTCSCPNVSEHYHLHPCEFRRSHSESIGDHAVAIPFPPGSSNYEMPCTLMSPDAVKLRRFEQRCERLHLHLFGESIAQGQINQPVFRRISEMLARIEQMPEHHVRELITTLEKE